MLSELLQFIKSSQYHIFLVICIILISYTSYNLGRIHALQKTHLKITESVSESTTKNLPDQLNAKANILSATKKSQISNRPQSATSSKKPATKVLDTRVVVSKKSKSHKYHYTWCSGAKRIKEENKIWFNSAQEAESGGYTLAGNCSK